MLSARRGQGQNGSLCRRQCRMRPAGNAELGLREITLALFVEAVDDENCARYEALYEDEETGVRMRPVFVATGT